MATKRKRKELTTTINSASKRPRRSSGSLSAPEAGEYPREIQDHGPDDSPEEGDFYEIKDIIAERKNSYLIDWKNDPKTGKTYSPTWEPKENANEEAIADWERKKQEKPDAPSRRRSSTTTEENSASTPLPSRRQNSRRKRLVITSSSDTSQAVETQQTVSPVQNNLELPVTAKSAQDLDGEPNPTPETQIQDLAVEISQRSPSHKDHYQSFLPSSQPEQVEATQNQSTQPEGDSGFTALLSTNSQGPYLNNSSPIRDPQRTIPDSQSVLDSPPSVAFGAQESQKQQEDHTNGNAVQSAIEKSNDGLSSKQDSSTASSIPSQIAQPALPSVRSSTPKRTYSAKQNSETPPAARQKRARLENSNSQQQLSIPQGATLDTNPRVQTASPTQHQTSVDSIDTGHYQLSNQNTNDSHQATLTSPGSLIGARTTPKSKSVEEAETPLRQQRKTNGFDQSTESRIHSGDTSGTTQIPPQSVENVFESVERDINTAQVTSEETPSSIPLPASQTLRNILSHHSSQPRTPSDMSDSVAPSQAPSTLTLKEKLRNMRAASAAARKKETAMRPLQIPAVERSLQLSNDFAKSPSAIPDRSPQAATIPTFPDLETPKLEFPALDQSSQDPNLVNISQTSSEGTLGEPLLGSAEYIVPLSMNARVQDQYQQTVFNYRESIDVFTRVETPDHKLVNEMEQFLQKINNVVIHADLENENILTQDVPEDEAHWAEASSTKFQFLGRLLRLCQHEEKHVAILAQPGRLLEILETYLKGIGISYSRPDVFRRPESALQQLTVTLIPTGQAGAEITVDRADLVIAFDKSFKASDQQLQGLRAHMFDVDRLSPVVHLMIVNSIEHLDRSISPLLKGIRRLQVLVGLVAQTRREVGQLPASFPTASGAAQEIAQFWTNEQPQTWPLPPMPEIAGMEKFTENETSHTSSQTASYTTNTPRDTFKRHIDVEDEDSYSAKKQRLTPAIDSGRVRVTGSVQDSNVNSGTQPLNALVQELNRKLAESQEETKKAQQQVLEEQTRVQELQSTFTSTERRLQEYVEALSDIQYRYEDGRREVSTLREELDSAVSGKAQAERRREAWNTEKGTLVEERSNLREELREARATLQTSAVPEVAELENVRAELRKALADKSSLERRLESMSRDFDFTRLQYQTASTAAADAATELSDLRQENEGLQKKASDQALKLRQLTLDGALEQHVARIGQLEAELSQTEALLRKKEEDLRIQARGRGMATRASSVPRSPKSYSRASSPNPAAMGGGRRSLHPLRKEELRRAEGP